MQFLGIFALLILSNSATAMIWVGTGRFGVCVPDEANDLVFALDPSVHAMSAGGRLLVHCRCTKDCVTSLGEGRTVRIEGRSVQFSDVAHPHAPFRAENIYLEAGEFTIDFTDRLRLRRASKGLVALDLKLKTSALSKIEKQVQPMRLHVSTLNPDRSVGTCAFDFESGAEFLKLLQLRDASRSCQSVTTANP